MIRVGVVGVGNMGTHHARILCDLPGAVLTGVHDVVTDRALAVASLYGTQAFPDLERLLAAVEAVVIAVPPELHHAVGRRALAAGCHVLMEKPLAQDLAAAEDLCRQAEAAGHRLMVGYVERFNPAVLQLKQELAGEELLCLNFTRVGPEPPMSGNAGVILDLAIHDLDLLLYLSGQEVVRSTALAGGTGRQDTASLSFLLSGGALAQVTANWLTPYKVREVQAATPRHLYRCDLMRQQLTLYTRLGREHGYAVREIPIRAQEPLRAELTAFIAALSGEDSGPASGIEGLSSLALAENCVRLAREAAATISPARE